MALFQEKNMRQRYVIGGNHSATNFLHVAKWEDAFEYYPGTPTIPVFKKPDFINGDVDRFHIVVEDATRGPNTAHVLLDLDHISADGAVTNSRTWKLEMSAPGVFTSTNLLVISDDYDYVYDNVYPGVAPNLHLRSCHAALGDRIEAVYDVLRPDGSYFYAVTNDTATVGADIKTVTLSVGVMKTNGVEVVDAQRIEQDIQRTRERFAQVNVRVATNAVVYFDAPDSVATNLNGWFIDWWDNGTLRMTQATRDIFDAAAAAGLSSNECIRAIYVPTLQTPSRNDIGGVAFMESYYQGGDLDYANSFFVAYPAKGFTFAHELVHVLTDEGHSSQLWNLMYKLEAVTNTPLAPKRLTKEQEQAIRKNTKFVK